MRNKRRQRSGFHCEPLETRVMPTGSVTASISNKVLTIQGDSNANVIEVFQTSVIDSYRVTGSSVTKVNGVTNGSFNFSLGRVDKIVINMSGGNDIVTVRGTSAPGINGDLDAPKGMSISMGSGNDTLTLRNLDVWQNDLTANLGTGNDRLTATDIRTEIGNFEVLTDTGTDTVSLTRINSGDDISVVSALSASVRVSIDDSKAVQTVDVDLSNGVDVVNIVKVQAKKLTVKLYSGNDKLNIKSSKFTTSASLNGGNGDDLLNFFSNVGDSSWIRDEIRSPTRQNILF